MSYFVKGAFCNPLSAPHFKRVNMSKAALPLVLPLTYAAACDMFFSFVAKRFLLLLFPQRARRRATLSPARPQARNSPRGSPRAQRRKSATRIFDTETPSDGARAEKAGRGGTALAAARSGKTAQRGNRQGTRKRLVKPLTVFSLCVVWGGGGSARPW